jgi:hypothetical protein
MLNVAKPSQAKACHAKSSQAKPRQTNSSQAKPSQAKPCQAKVITGGENLRKAQVDVLLSVSPSRVAGLNSSHSISNWGYAYANDFEFSFKALTDLVKHICLEGPGNISGIMFSRLAIRDPSPEWLICNHQESDFISAA